MITAKLAQNEDQRLQELFKYDILDTPEEQEYTDIVKLASQICQAPIALISLLDDCRQWFKAGVGISLSESPRETSFCAHAIHYESVMIVEDATKDERFYDNPLVTRYNIRFYAGAPLYSPAGYKLGTLCILDNKVRSLSKDQIFALETLSRHVVQKFELRKKSDHLRQLFQQYLELQAEFESRQQAFAKAQRSAEIAIYELDVKKDKLKAYGSFYQLFGLKEEKEYTREDLHKLVHPDDYPAYLSFFENAFKNEKQFDFEYRCLRPKSNEEVYLRSTGEIIRDSEGNASRLLGVKQNISEKKKNEEALRSQNEELLKVNQELDHFVSRVSHDLRAPISTVLGLIELILKHEQDVDKIKELLVHVKNSLHKQDNFIGDILDYSRNSRMPLIPEPIDFRALVEEILSQLVYSYEAGKVHHSLEVEQTHEFVGDKSRLYVILTNLLSNAFKYLNVQQESGEVRVHVKVNPKQAVIQVEDTGIGIEEKHLHKVCDMFYRATDKKPGSGLGLYIVKESVSKLGGSISLRSKVGEGTKVQVEVPNLKKQS